ncbi:MAG: NAD(+) synthase [Spirochaetota bacterium]
MGKNTGLSQDQLKINPEQEYKKIEHTVVHWLQEFKKKGVVVAVSGGVDSSVVTSLCLKALGNSRVLGLLLPEKDSSESTLRLSRKICDHLNIESVYEDITPILEAVGCYRRRDEAIRTLIPEHRSDFQVKIVLPSVLEDDKLRLFSVVVRSPEGTEKRARLNRDAYLGIVSATNFKQRVRKMLEYYHADRRNYAVAGTPNRLEYDQGFFVKLGDGYADLKPIAHLYKTQVYQMANYLGIPEEIRTRPPTTDTYSMPQSQEEFYFSLPYHKMDLCLFGKNHGYTARAVAEAAGLTPEQTERIFNDIDQKRSTTRYLHMGPRLVEQVGEITYE